MWHKISRVPHIRGWVGGRMGWGGLGGQWAKVTLQTQWDQLLCQRSCLQTTLQGKAGCLITIMDNWEQFHTNTTLLKPTKHCHSLIRDIQGHEKAVWKADLAIYSYSVVVSG